VTDTFDLHKALMDAYYSTPIVDDPRTGAWALVRPSSQHSHSVSPTN
jgi:hypothetical protein